jgi:hypothetical protein
MQVSSSLLALLEQCLLPSAAARPSIDAVYECLVSACSAEDAQHL